MAPRNSLVRPATALVWGVALAIGLASGAVGQNITKRLRQSPDGGAKTSQILAEGALRGASQGQSSLVRNNLGDGAVNTQCGPLTIGGTQNPNPTTPPTTLVGSNTLVKKDNNVVITGSVVNICRR